MQCKFEGHSPVDDCNTVLAVRLRGKFLLELPAFVAGPVVNLAGVKHASGGLHFILLKMRPSGKGSDS